MHLDKYIFGESLSARYHISEGRREERKTWKGTNKTYGLTSAPVDPTPFMIPSASFSMCP